MTTGIREDVIIQCKVAFFKSCKCILLLTLQTRIQLEAGQIILHVCTDGFQLILPLPSM